MPTSRGSEDRSAADAAWVVTGSPGGAGRIALESRPPAALAEGEVRLAVRVCGVCRTDLHVADGDLPPRRPRVVPGHEVVGHVVEVGPGVRDVAPGDRLGAAWLRSTCGACRWCLQGDENLCPSSTYTGWDADGGYARQVTVPAAYAYRLPDELPDTEAAPLLCAGIIGYRALRRARLPHAGRLGIYGFGASAHLTTQIALGLDARVHVMTRGAGARELALEMGADSAQGAYAAPPEPLDAAILFAPVGDLVPVALAALDRGGVLSVAGIHLTDVPPLDYQRHLFRERTLTTVTANTRADGEELLRLAGRLGVRPRVTTYPFDAADRALDDLAEGRVVGVAVLDLR